MIHYKLPINCAGYCKECLNKSINYSINNGSFVYYCNFCDKYISRYDILSYREYKIITDDKPSITKTLGELLESKNETIKRNAMSILKTLNK